MRGEREEEGIVRSGKSVSVSEDGVRVRVCVWTGVGRV